MYERYPDRSIERGDTSKSALALATFVLAAIVLAALSLAPHDQSRLVKGVSCSILTEQEIAAVLGTHVQMLAPSGNICRYVSTGEQNSTLTVVARQDPRPPAEWEQTRPGTAMYVRSGKRSYVLVLSQPGRDEQAVTNEEMRLAALIRFNGVVAHRSL